MKKLFRKTMTVLGSVALLGATMSGALAASYPEPFTASNTAVVVGSSAAASDTTAATSIATDLGMDAASSSATTVVGGDSVDLGEVLGDIVLGGNIGGTLYDEELPSILGDDSVDSVDYFQELVLGAHTVEYSNLGDDEDNYVVHSDFAEEKRPVLNIDHSTTALWTYTLTFDEDFNATDAGNERMVIAGKEYTVDPNLGTTGDLVLYASSNTVDVTYGESETVTVGGEDFVVEVTGGRDLDDPEATVSINGENSRVTAGDTIEKDGEEFYISEVFMNTFGDANTMSVEIFAGAEKLAIEDTSAASVTLGDDIIDSVEGYYTNDGGDDDLTDLQSIVLEFTPSEADYDYDAEYQEYSYLELGEAVTDPVLGTFSVFFESASQELTEDKEMIELSQSGDELKIDFTNLAGTEFSQTLLKADTAADYPLLGLRTEIADDTGDFLALDRTDRKEKLILQKDGNDGSITEIVTIYDVELDSSDEVVSVTFSYQDGSTEKVNVEDEIRRSADDLYVCYGGSAYDLVQDGNETNEYLWTENKSAFSLRYDGCADGATDTYSGDPVYNGSLELYAANEVTVDLSNLVEASTSADITLTETHEDASDNDVVFTTTWDTDEYIVEYTSGADGAEDDENEMGYYLTDFGSYIEVEAEDNTWAKVYTPEEEVTYNVLVATEVSSDEDEGDTGKLTVLDSESDAYSGKNLIVVGGSAVNSVAAELLGFDEGENTHGEGFTAKTGVVAGEALIEAFDRDGKVALLVAGYDAADTTKAASYLVGDIEEVSTDAGKKYKVTSQTEATAITA